jgi:hypothetical protein
MAGKVFINYRRGDDPGNTGRLFDRLQEAFQPDQLFLDIDSIAPGLDFVRVLEEYIGQCDALLAVIGPRWLNATDPHGNRRLDDPNDFVRIEIESALKQDKRVIPVLVGETKMPRPDELPAEIRSLARRNAVRLTHERFRADAQGLVKALQQALDEAEALRQAHAETARQARAKEEREREEAAATARAKAQREAEEQARRDKEQARLAKAEGLVNKVREPLKAAPVVARRSFVASAAGRLITPGQWPIVAGSAMALLLVGWIGFYRLDLPIWVSRRSEEPKQITPPLSDSVPAVVAFKGAEEAERQRLAAVKAQSASTVAFQQRRNMKASGSEISYTNAVDSIVECQQKCAQSDKCVVFTFNKSVRSCYLYSNASLAPDKNYDSGLK